MSHKDRWLQFNPWLVPLLYALVAIAAGLTFPRFESRLFPGFDSQISVSAAMAIYSSIASGMLALTGVVFSLAFVMVQFSAIAYSPRLVLWIARAPLMKHALGVFTATFLYAIAALAWVDRSSSGKTPFVSAWIVISLLLASVGMLIGLIQRVALLQVNRMLSFTSSLGREIIDTLYPSRETVPAVAASAEFRELALTQTLIYRGRPQAMQGIDVKTLMNLSNAAGGVIEMVAAVGDTALELTPLLHVFGAREAIDERRMRNAIEFGEYRTFEQDPKYAIRLLVDIAIKALSSAVNDPTTAVQALDQIEDLLLRLGGRRLEIGAFRDSGGKLRLVVPFPTWEDFLRLALEEIRIYGATSVQVLRRMRALVIDLMAVLPEERHAALKHWDERLQATSARSFSNAEEKLEALVGDRQGLGIDRRSSIGI